MSYFDLTDNQNNRYRLEPGPCLPGHWIGIDTREYIEAREVLERIDSLQIFMAEGYFFFCDIGSLPALARERRLGKDWRKAHSMGAEAFASDLDTLLDAIYHGELALTRLTSRNPQREEENRRAILRVQIRQALAAIIAQEKAEAASHARALANESGINRTMIYTGAFFNGLWNAGSDLAKWVKEVSDVLSPTQRALRAMHSGYKAVQHSRSSDDNFFEAYADEHLKAEKRELVQALGFDPSAITSEQLDQAMEVADLIWDDPALRADITRFAKDYAYAQHSVELTNLSGSAAFEVLFTVILAAVTAGAGFAISAASQTRHLAKLRKVGNLLMEFAEQVKKARQRLRRSNAKGGGGSSRSFDELPVEEVSVEKSPVDESIHPPRKQAETKPENDTPTVTPLNRSELEQQLVARLGQDIKNNPLRQEYEAKVAELAKYQQALTDQSIRNKAVANMANLPGSEKSLAETAHNARRQLGIEYKNLTPEPLRDYIYEVNLKRYGDPLGPSVDLLVQRGKTYPQIVESAARPNPDVNKLLEGFAKWLSKQPDDYVQKHIHLLSGK